MSTTGGEGREDARASSRDDTRYGLVLHRVMADPSLSVQSRMIYALLATFANPAGGDCRPTIERLEAEVGLSKSNVIRYLNELVEAGIVERGGTNRRREYRLISPTDRTIRESDAPPPLAGADGNSPTGETDAHMNSPADETNNGPTGGTSPSDRTNNSPAGRTQTIPVEQKEEERDECARATLGLEIIEGWTAETMPIYSAFVEWTGHPPDAPFRRTVALLLLPRGSPSGARIFGGSYDGRLFNGYAVARIVESIEALWTSNYAKTATNLVKFVAGLTKIKHLETNDSHQQASRQPASYDDLSDAVARELERTGATGDS